VVLMAADPLDEVLRLVAEGRLTAEEAVPILAALDEPPARDPADASRTRGPGAASGSEPGVGSGPAAGAESMSGGSLRLEIREAGRQVVQLRLPLAIGRYALDRVPGLSGEQVDSVREALRTGMKGPVLEVEDGANSVRIVVD
jgi:hypothetical protein